MDSMWMWLAWRLPRPLRYWATIKNCADATTGEWSDTVVTDLTVTEMLRRI